MLAVMLALACGGDGTTTIPDASAAPPDGAICPGPEPVWPDIELASFALIPELDGLDLDGHVALAEPATYWELRVGNSRGHRVLASAGMACADATDPESCLMQLAALSSNIGFGAGCLPLRCIHYVAVNRGDQVEVIADIPGLLAFFGSIDTPMEAALLALAHGYTWSAHELDSSGARAAVDGYELLVTQLVRDCDPIILDRVLLSVSSAGAIAVQRRQHAAVACGACI